MDSGRPSVEQVFRLAESHARPERVRRRADYGLVLAAGEGQRFGQRKQFARLRGRPLVYFSLRAFELCSAVGEVVLVTNAEEICRAERIIRNYRLRKVRWIIAGGPRRQDSVMRGLEVLPNRGTVAIHDSARPNLPPDRLEQGYSLCHKKRAVIFGLPVVETVKEVAHSQVTKTIPRANLVTAQTPQFFDVGLIKRAYREAMAAGLEVTDDAQAVEHLGERVWVIQGWPDNVKVTTRSDISHLARCL